MRPNLYDDTAHLYDFGNVREQISEDVAFYISTIASGAKVLEVGCGTGRVALSLASHGCSVTGVDLSEAMLAVFREKVAAAGDKDVRIRLECADMRFFDLSEAFDWILFPFRVFQALTLDEDRRACLRAVKKHMSKGSRAVLTLFNPRQDVLEAWGRKNILDFEGADEVTGRSVKRYQDQMWHDADRQIIATHLRYEVYENGKLAQSLTDDLELGYLYPEQCLRLFLEAGLVVRQAYGDYDRRELRADEQREQIYVLGVE